MVKIAIKSAATYALIAGAVLVVLLYAICPTSILTLYKACYVKYTRIAKSDFSRRFSDAQLQEAISNARNQAWINEQIAADLEPFNNGITKQQIDTWFVQLQHAADNKLVKFIVADGLVSAQVAEDLQDSRAFKTVHSVIELLAKKKLIPNCTFIVALNDYLAYVPPGFKESVAIFSFAKHTGIPVEKNLILVPDWMNVRYWDVLRGRIRLANRLYPWDDKIQQIHWRGGKADSMQHRGKLIALQQQLPFLDVGFTEGENPLPKMDPEQSVKYKYQIALDGARCTWERMVWQMYSNTVMLKPDSPEVQWFHRGLKPYANYLPLQDVDASSLKAAYAWLVEHDSEALGISRNANAFARENFKTQDLVAYYVLALERYAGLLR